MPSTKRGKNSKVRKTRRTDARVDALNERTVRDIVNFSNGDLKAGGRLKCASVDNAFATPRPGAARDELIRFLDNRAAGPEHNSGSSGSGGGHPAAADGAAAATASAAADAATATQNDSATTDVGASSR